MMEVFINGKSCACKPDEYLLDVAGRNGFDIPVLCHHQGIRGQGCCRVCIVEMNGRVVPACVTKPESACKVTTDSEKIKEIRKTVIALLAMRAPLSEEIAQMVQKYDAPSLTRLTPVEESERCVLCGLCARACHSLGAGAISAVNRGVDKKIAPPYEEEPASCIGCGSCAEVCPTTAIPVEQTTETRKIWGRVFSMKKCCDCAAQFTTHEAAKHTAAKLGRESSELCERCRKARTSAVIFSTSSNRAGYP